MKERGSFLSLSQSMVSEERAMVGEKREGGREKRNSALMDRRCNAGRQEMEAGRKMRSLRSFSSSSSTCLESCRDRQVRRESVRTSHGRSQAASRP